MIGITIICLGKLKENYLRDASAEYIKRLSAFSKLSVIELTPEKLPESPSEKQIENALQTEGRKIIEKIPKGAFVYTMCIEGKQRTSEQFSRELDDIATKGFSNIVFIIGSSFGLCDEVKKLSNERFSMSKMTFPHQLARIMLLEQIYRAVQISKGTKYHK